MRSSEVSQYTSYSFLSLGFSISCTNLPKKQLIHSVRFFCRISINVETFLQFLFHWGYPSLVKIYQQTSMRILSIRFLFRISTDVDNFLPCLFHWGFQSLVQIFQKTSMLIPFFGFLCRILAEVESFLPFLFNLGFSSLVQISQKNQQAYSFRRIFV